MIYLINPLNKRFYYLLVQKDIFETWCLRKVYGGLSNNRSRDIWLPVSSETEAHKLLLELEYKKRQHGYIYADMYIPEHFQLKPQTICELI